MQPKGLNPKGAGTVGKYGYMEEELDYICAIIIRQHFQGGDPESSALN